ncbi:DUF2057 family protein [Psychromonas aquatilis]|uniref:DUF2057 family protein n=1 Tax=Psychromonas aquatilis TaxID=2005072 RepID=A0ABU9GMK8_9GAMM
MKFSGLLLTLAISPLAFSGEIITTNDIQILSINGTEVESSFFEDGALTTKDGEQQIVARYSRTFRDKPILESRPFIFNIDVAGKTTLTTEELNSYSQAKNEISKGLNWYVKNEQKSYTVDNPEELIGKGFLPYSDIGALVAQYNIDNNLVVSNAPDIQSVTKMKTNSLIQFYQSATPEQQQEFKEWYMNNAAK